MSDTINSVKKFIGNNLVWISVAILAAVAVILYNRQIKTSTEVKMVNEADDMDDIDDSIDLKPNNSDRNLINKRLEQLCQTQGDIIN